MNIRLLGTGAAEGIPALFCGCDICTAAAKAGGRNIRGRSCAMIGGTVMIDFPPDMLAYKVRYWLDLARISSIFFTHSHLDHLAAGELCYYHKMYSGRDDSSPALKLFGNEKVLRVINETFIFDLRYMPDCVSLNLLRAYGTVEAGGVRITPLPAVHDPREECFMFLIERQNGKVLLANDSAGFLDEVYEYLRGLHLDAVILDCTICEHPSRVGSTHMCFEDNLNVKARLTDQGSADEGTIFISHHFSHNGGVNYDNFESLAAGTGFISSYDGMEIDI